LLPKSSTIFLSGRFLINKTNGRHLVPSDLAVNMTVILILSCPVVRTLTYRFVFL
jgi:hypothetical protein